MTRALALVLLLHATPAQAEWSRFDLTAQGAVIGALALDWSQSLQVARAGKEANPFLGHSPSIGASATYFVGAAMLHTTIAHVLPRRARTVWQGIWFAAELGAIGLNHQAGFRLSLP